jgi:hypothetical protein
MNTHAPSLSLPRLARLDFIGSVLSTLCAIHCLAMPIIAGLLPVLGLSFLGDRAFERAACVAMTLLACACLVTGCRQHRRWWLLALLGTGASLTLGTQFLFAADTATTCAKACCAEGVNWTQALVMFTGGGLIATAHLLNLRFGRACGCCANVPQTLAVSGGVRAWTSRETPRRRTGLSTLAPLIAAMGFFLAPSTRAAHSDIILSRTNGVLQVDNTIHTGNVRENDAAGNGTVWATDNPGFAGSGFRFNDEFLFDITGPLKRWDGTNWSTANIGPEFMEFVEPGPFGDALNSVTITRATTFATGYLIAQTGTRGTLHTHFVFILRATNGVAPAVGAYSFPLTIRSPHYTSAPPVHLVFNNGLDESNFSSAVEQFTAAQEMRLSLGRRPSGALVLSLFTVEGRTNQLLSAPTPAGPWTNDGAPFPGTGGRQEFTFAPTATNRFFRITAP